MKVIFKLIIVTLLLLSGCYNNKNVPSEYTAYVTIHKNPGIGFMVNQDAIVNNFHALNEDGEVLLCNLTLEGKTITKANKLISRRMLELGYIELNENRASVEVLVIAENTDVEKKVSGLVREDLSLQFLGLNTNVIVEQRAYDSKFLKEAKSMGIDSKKYHLINQTLLREKDLSLDDIKKMSEKQLINRLKDNINNQTIIVSSLNKEYLSGYETIYNNYNPRIGELEDKIKLSRDRELEDLLIELDKLNADMKRDLTNLKEQMETRNEDYQRIIQDKYNKRINKYKERVDSYLKKHH